MFSTSTPTQRQSPIDNEFYRRWTLVPAKRNVQLCESNCRGPVPPKSPPSMSSHPSCQKMPNSTITLFSTPLRPDTRFDCSACPKHGVGFWPEMTTEHPALDPIRDLRCRKSASRPP